MIDPRAAVSSSAEIGAGSRVGPFAVIEEDVIIGRDCLIAAHAVVKQFTTMGDGNQVHEGAVLGGMPQDLKYGGHGSRLEVGHRNVFREGVTVNRATAEDGVTLLGNDNFLMTSSHVAHECRLGNHVVLANCVALAGHVELQDRCFLSGGVVVHQFCRIGKLAMVGGNAKVTQDVLPFFLADGVPARHRSPNLVGLRRADLPRDEIQSLKEAFRLLANRGAPLPQKIEKLSQIASPAVAHLVEFLRRSERSFCGF